MQNVNKTYLIYALCILVSFLNLGTLFLFDFSDFSNKIVSISQNKNIINIKLDTYGREINYNDFKIVINGEIYDFSLNFEELKEFITKEKAFTILKLPINIAGHCNISIFKENEKIFSKKLVIPNDFKQTKYTTINCHGLDFSDRWCEFKNICRKKDNFVFLSPFPIDFHGEIISPSSRKPPYHRTDVIVGHDNITVKKEVELVSWKNTTGVFVSRFYNNGMLWHNVMDFVVPMYRTIKAANATDDCQIVMLDKDGKFGLFYAKPICRNVNIISKEPNVCYERAIVGNIKTTGKEKETMVYHNYEIPHKDIAGLRERMLESTNKTKCKIDPKHPKIVIIKRKQDKNSDNKRRIINVDDVVLETKKLCPLCDVRGIDLQTRNKLQQVELACDTSLLIGIHGSGLVHALWMQESTKEAPTAIVEIIPYMYTCRNWYNKLADAAGVEYIPLYTKRINQSRWAAWNNGEKVNKCHSNKKYCNQGACHDFLRDQSVIVDIKQYKKAIYPFIKRLLKNM